MGNVNTKSIAAVVPVGVDAVVGDISVTAVVLTPKIDDKLVLTQTPNGISLRLELRNKETDRVLADFSMTLDHSTGTFEYSSGGLVIPPDALLGMLFDEYAGLPEFVTTVGFCPKSEDDMKVRLQSIAKHLTKIVRDKYPSCSIHVSPEMFDFDLEKLWERGRRPFPSAPIGVNNVELDVSERWGESDVLRLMFAHLIAEAIGTGVRSARCMDHGEIYPVLRLETNLGYSCAELLRGLQKTQGFAVKGLRNKLTEQWVTWAGKNLNIYESPVTGGDVDPAEDGKVYKDSQGRDAMKLSRAACQKMLTELDKEFQSSSGRAANFRPWAQKIFPSMKKQFDSGRNLSGRQAYLLHALYNEKMR